MKSICRYFLILAALFVTTASFGQSVHDLRLNEMMIKNVDNYADEYGRHVPWVEIFNTAYNTVNITGCYLTDDTTGLAAAGKKGGTIPSHWYKIPTDQKMYMPQRSFLIFYLDDSPLYGPYHTNFDPAKSNSTRPYIALINANGKELLDIVEYPVSLRDTVLTYGYVMDGQRDAKAFKKGTRASGELDFLKEFTPNSSNETVAKESKQDELKRRDKYGIGMALISMAVVFTALIMIYIMLKIFNYVTRRSTQKSKAQEKPAAVVAAKPGEEKDDTVDGPTIAAIGTALHLHFGSMHDEESEVITINMPSKHYSPWAQKELVMKKNPRSR